MLWLLHHYLVAVGVVLILAVVILGSYPEKHVE